MQKKLSFNQIVWIFTAACFIGYVIEMVFCIVVHGRIESRQGVVFGPLTPIYGVGAVAMCFTSIPIYRKKGVPLTVLISGLVGCTVEFVGSYLEEHVLGTRSWDFSDHFLNLNGRTSLLFLCFWGVLGCIFAKLIYPWMLRFIERRKLSRSKALCGLIAVFMIGNFSISAMAVERWVDRTDGIPARHIIARHLDRCYDDETMKVIFPKMEFIEGK